MKLKKLIIPSSLIIASPLVVASCTSTILGDISKQEQSSRLESEEAKISLHDSWLTSTYVSLYVSHIAPNATQSDQEKIANTIKVYLKYLDWNTSSQQVQNDPEFKSSQFADDALLSQAQKQVFEDNLKGAYIFYINFRSKIKESDNSPSPETYFLIKSLEWQKKQYSSIIGGQIMINNFKPGLRYKGYNPNNNQLIEPDFKILMSTRGTLVYQNVIKLLLAEMYFLHGNKDQIVAGTNYNKMTKNPSSVNYINTKAYVEKVKDQEDFSLFLFKKYLIENAPMFKWSYTTEDYTTANTISGRISTEIEFNNLKTTKETSLGEILIPTSSDNLANLQAFESLSINTTNEGSTSFEGDLAVDVNTIKAYGTIKSGLLDKDKNKLLSFSELETVKQARTYNQGKDPNAKLMLPSINIKNSSLEKSSREIELDDLDIKWGSTSATIDNASKTKYSGLFTYNNGQVEQKLKVNAISFSPKSDEASIIISFTYEFVLNGKTYKLSSDFTISNWNNSSEGLVNPFKESVPLDGIADNVGIRIFDEKGASLGVSYSLRVLPIFKRSEIDPAIRIGESWYSKGEFTLKSTPWETEKEQKKLIYFLMLTDSNLYTKIKNFYLFNNYNVEGDVTELKTIISALGLTKKTDEDRRVEGII